MDGIKGRVFTSKFEQVGARSSDLYEAVLVDGTGAGHLQAWGEAGRILNATMRNGNVYGAGNNGQGSLGIGSTSDQISPTRVASLTGVTGVAAGQYHSLFVVRNCSQEAH